ncbi:MAG: tol-pal system protein YbgF [Gammaproteobacteria bacterium]|nr:tol-pal system protein YbgF [Gammaproteobacteria bacterium]
MNKSIPVLSPMLLLAGFLGWSAIVVAAPAGVFESSGQGTSSNNDALLLLLEQNQNLQAEVQALRALVEEQGYEVRKLRRESLDRYTNTDSRLSALEQSGVAGTASTTTSTESLLPDTRRISPQATGATDFRNNGRVATPTPGGGTDSVRSASGSVAAINTPRTRTTPSRPSLEPAVLSEQQLYQMAYDSAINSRFDRAIAEFDQYLSIYPNGRFSTNAFYWKGQAYLYLSRYDEAIAAYDIILQQYSDSAKVPDAMYGLGVAYEGLGDTRRARQLLQEIVSKYPNTGVANLAGTRLLSLD